VTFDTGGISIKPAGGMDEMKMDMGGSAAVVGLMKALAAQKSKKDVVGIVGLAENMPSANAYRPGDIIRSYSGKHIEVLNTDAEGRLVLADCLTHIQKEYDPSFIVDLATLTGAMMVALAHEYTGVFVNDDKLWNGLNEAGTATGEKVWRMPLDDAYRKDVEGDIGDVRNLAKNGRWGGACTAAAFLEHFIDDKRKWAHMDIAGTAFSKGDLPLSAKGGTGVGVRLLENFVHHQK
jgi:leucyl aminopeptidase